VQANTVGIDVRAGKSSDISVEKRTYHRDPFEIRDGRYVGHDGFVVPKDFNEFYRRFPNYVRQWVSNHGGRSASSEDVEDWTQDLLIHLFHLPEKSKHREAGSEDIIQTFDPSKHYGANQARFRNYVNLCLANKFKTMHSKRMKDALCRPNNFSIDGLVEPALTDEFCHSSSSSELREAVRTDAKQRADGVLVQDFMRFVRRCDPKSVPLVNAVLATGTHAEAADHLGVTEAEFKRMRYRLDRLRHSFMKGEPLRQRRPYKRRVRKTFSGTS